MNIKIMNLIKKIILILILILIIKKIIDINKEKENLKINDINIINYKIDNLIIKKYNNYNKNELKKTKVK